jgi:beta-glucosidase
MDIMADPRAAEALKPLLDGICSALMPAPDASVAATEAISGDMAMAMMKYMPLRGAVSFGGGAIDVSWVQSLLDQINE